MCADNWQFFESVVDQRTMKNTRMYGDIIPPQRVFYSEFSKAGSTEEQRIVGIFYKRSRFVRQFRSHGREPYQELRVEQKLHFSSP